MIAEFLLKTIEQAMNKFLSLDPETSQRMKRLQGKIIQVEIQGLNLNFFLFTADRGIHLQTDYAGDADTKISGGPFSLLKLGIDTHLQKPSSTENIAITGDLEVGQQVQDIFAHLDIDWEEHLAKKIGDSPAHCIGTWFQNTIGWGKKAAHSTRDNIDEYVHEEINQFPRRDEVEDFMTAVDTLRADVDRFKTHLDQFETKD